MIPIFSAIPVPSFEELDDAILRTAGGESEGMERLYELIRVPVYSYALSILKNPHDAQDVLHDCVLQVIRKAGDYRSQQKPMAWIMTVTKNLCLMKKRQEGKADFLEEEEWLKLAAEPGSLSHEEKLLIRECLNELSDVERQTVILHAVSGLKHYKIAQLTDCSLSTELSRYHRALKKLKSKLEGSFDREKPRTE